MSDSSAPPTATSILLQFAIALRLRGYKKVRQRRGEFIDLRKRSKDRFLEQEVLFQVSEWGIHCFLDVRVAIPDEHLLPSRDYQNGVERELGKSGIQYRGFVEDRWALSEYADFMQAFEAIAIPWLNSLTSIDRQLEEVERHIEHGVPIPQGPNPKPRNWLVRLILGKRAAAAPAMPAVRHPPIAHIRRAYLHLWQGDLEMAKRSLETYIGLYDEGSGFSAHERRLLARIG